MATPARSGPRNTVENTILVGHLGFFTVMWSIFDMLIDAAIMKELGLTPMQGAIVTSSLAHKAKISILRSLLNLDSKKNAEALSTLGKITQLAGRNSIMHGHVHIGDTSLSFVKMDVDSQLTAKQKRFENLEFGALVTEIANLVKKVQGQLGLSQEDLDIIPNIGKSLANKTSTSPTSPSAKKV
jgi:hypothetical protein